MANEFFEVLSKKGIYEKDERHSYRILLRISFLKSIEIPICEKMTLTFEEAAAYSNIGINKIRNLADDPRCSFVLHIGKRKLIKRKENEKLKKY